MSARVRAKRPPQEAATRTILDSGAYSAYTQNKEVNAEEYIRYCVQYQHHYSRIIVLDTIPPKTEEQKKKKKAKYDKGTYESTSPEAAEFGAKNSFDMWVRMRDAGIQNATPVFHRFERFYWLERYLDEGADYICFGPGAYSSHSKKRDWLDQCFSTICDSDGYPTVDTHGLAVTSVELIMRYPWTSVDSAAWCKRAGFGVVLVPKGKNKDGSYDYSRGAWSVAVSDVAFEQAMGKDGQRKIFFNLSKAEKDYVLEYLRTVCGKNFSEVAISPHHRRVCNIVFFHELGKSHNVDRFVQTRGLF